MDGLIVHETPKTKLTTMVVAFAGWPDAAEAATRAIRYMVRKLPSKKIAEIDPENYYDFTVNRPQTRINRRKERIIKWPTNEFYSYVPENDPEAGFWFTLVPSQIVDYVGIPVLVITSYYADALRTSEVVTLPIGAKTELNLRNAHLSYAMTWYGIALALVGVYGAFHYQAGRLRFGGKAQKG